MKIKTLIAAYKLISAREKKPICLFKSQDGTLRAFEVNCRHTNLSRLCECISEIPGVVFTKKPRSRWAYFTWWGDGIEARAEFSYKEHDFIIDGEGPWEGGDHWIGPKETSVTYPEITDILERVETQALGHRR